MDHDILLPLQTQVRKPSTEDANNDHDANGESEQNMATSGDVEPTASCSHHGSTKEIEYDFKPKGDKVEDGGDDLSDSNDDDRDCIKFTPSIPSRPQIDLKGREVIFAIASFFLISVCIGLIVILATMQMQSKTVRFPFHPWGYQSDKISSEIHWGFVQIIWLSFPSGYSSTYLSDGCQRYILVVKKRCQFWD